MTIKKALTTWVLVAVDAELGEISDEFLEMTMCYETEKAEFETARNEAVDAYFAARPQIFRTREKECYVEAGFRMAWDFLKQNQKDENRSSSV